MQHESVIGSLKEKTAAKVTGIDMLDEQESAKTHLQDTAIQFGFSGSLI